MIKRYLAEYNKLVNKGVYGISLVENPAMEGEAIFLKKQEEKVQFKTVNKEKRIVLGMILQPDFDVYRYDEKTGEEYYISFPQETILELAHDFIENGYQNNSTIEHKTKINGVSLVETWIIEDDKMDKTRLYGMNEKVGSWVGMMKINNDDVWNDYIKTGKIGGFSVDAVISLKEVNFKSEINMSKEVLEETQKQTSILTELATAIKTAFTKEVKEVVKVEFGSVKTADGAITIEYDGEELVAGINAWITAEDGTRVPIPVGEHALENDMVIVVTEEGLIAEVKEAMQEQPSEAPQAEPMSEQAKSDAEVAKEIENAIKSILIKYEAQEKKLNEIEAKFAEVVKDNEVLKVALSEEPAKKPIKSQPTQTNQKLTLSQRLENKLNK